MFYTHNPRQPLRPAPVRGFGLIELLVTMSIMALVSGVVLVRQSSFNGAVVLRNQTYEVAYTIRQAQLFAVSGTAEATGSASGQRYGVQFDGASDTYFLYRVDGASRIPVGQVQRLDRRFEIGDLVTNSGTHSTINIEFQRPNFDAIVTPSTGGGTAYIDIRVKGTTGTAVGSVRRVEVIPTGNISVVTY